MSKYTGKDAADRAAANARSKAEAQGAIAPDAAIGDTEKAEPFLIFGYNGYAVIGVGVVLASVAAYFAFFRNK